jgi:hypothetical protein
MISFLALAQAFSRVKSRKKFCAELLARQSASRADAAITSDNKSQLQLPLKR